MTTSPLNTTEIEHVFGDEQPPALPATTRQEWSRFFRFLARPRLPETPSVEPGKALAVARMLVLDFGVMGVLIGILAAASAMGFEPPENVNNELAHTVLNFLLVALIVPIAEELVFRSWLNGRPAVIAAVAIVVAGFAGLPWALTQAGYSAETSLLIMIGPALAVLGAPLAAGLLLSRVTPQWFRSGFVPLFWLSTVGFALIHLMNYKEFSWVLFPLVLPQLALGAMLGYLRVHYGLITAIALHAMHNGILFSVAILGGAFGGGS